MHENREISSTPWSSDQGRSAKATSRAADIYALEKSGCGVVPVNQPNKEGQPSAEVGEGRTWIVKNILGATCSRHRAGTSMYQTLGGCAASTTAVGIHDKSRMRKRAHTDVCGGRPAKAVPTATATQERASFGLNGRVGRNS